MDLNLPLARWSFRHSTSARLRLWRKLASLLANGVPLLRGLTELYERRVQTHGPQHMEALALRIWRERISNGGTLATAIEGWVTTDEQMLVGAGEEQGDMGQAFDRLELLLTSRSLILKAVLAGVSYPLVLLCLVFGLLIFYAWKIIPVYLSVADAQGGSFTGLAASLVWLSGAVRHWVWLWILLTVLGLLLFLGSLSRWDGALRVRLDRYAPYSVYRVMRGTAWMLSLAALVSVGRRIEDALVLLQQHERGRWSRRRSALCLAGIRRGLSLGAALEAAHTEFPDREVIADLLIYSRLNGADKAINILAQDLLADSLARIQNQSLLMRNVGFLAVAGVIAWTTSGLIDMNIQMGRLLSGASQYSAVAPVRPDPLGPTGQTLALGTAQGLFSPTPGHLRAPAFLST